MSSTASSTTSISTRLPNGELSSPSRRGRARREERPRQYLGTPPVPSSRLGKLHPARPARAWPASPPLVFTVSAPSRPSLPSYCLGILVYMMPSAARCSPPAARRPPSAAHLPLPAAHLPPLAARRSPLAARRPPPPAARMPASCNRLQEIRFHPTRLRSAALDPHQCIISMVMYTIVLVHVAVCRAAMFMPGARPVGASWQ